MSINNSIVQYNEEFSFFIEKQKDCNYSQLDNTQQYTNTQQTQYIFKDQPPQKLSTMLLSFIDPTKKAQNFTKSFLKANQLTDLINILYDSLQNQLETNLNSQQDILSQIHKKTQIVMKPQVLGQMGIMFTTILSKQVIILKGEMLEIRKLTKLEEQIEEEARQRNLKTKKKKKVLLINRDCNNEESNLYEGKTKRKNMLEEKELINKRSKELQEIEELKYKERNLLGDFNNSQLNITQQQYDISFNLNTTQRSNDLFENFRYEDDNQSIKSKDNGKGFMHMMEKMSNISHSDLLQQKLDFEDENQYLNNDFQRDMYNNNKQLFLNKSEQLKEFQGLDLEKFKWESQQSNENQKQKVTKKKKKGLRNLQDIIDENQSDSEMILDDLYISKKKNTKKKFQFKKNNNKKMETIFTENIYLDQVNLEENDLNDIEQQIFDQLILPDQYQNESQIKNQFQQLIQNQIKFEYEQSIQEDQCKSCMDNLYNMLENLNENQEKILKTYIYAINSIYLEDDEIDNIRATNDFHFPNQSHDNIYQQQDNQIFEEPFSSQKDKSSSNIDFGSSFLNSSNKKDHTTKDPTNQYNFSKCQEISEHVTTENLTSLPIFQNLNKSNNQNLKKIDIKVKLPTTTETFLKDFIKNYDTNNIQKENDSTVKFNNLCKMQESGAKHTSNGEKFYNLMMLQASKKIELIDKKQPEIIFQQQTNGGSLVSYKQSSLLSDIYIKPIDQIVQ